MKAEYAEISTDSIVEETRLRQDLGDLGTLENSIAKFGLLCPLIVDRNNALICGARRLAAGRRIGLNAVPVIRLDIDFDSMEALDMQTDENLCRRPLSEDELSRHIQMKKDLSTERPAENRRRTLLDRIKGMFAFTPVK
ncbi:MAG: ParB N-terminal domain-containing protein [Kiritimatiellia bacterium]